MISFNYYLKLIDFYEKITNNCEIFLIMTYSSIILWNIRHICHTDMILMHFYSDTKSVIISPKTKKERQCNEQMKRNKSANHDMHHNIKNTKDLATRTKQKTGGELKCSGRGAVPISLVLPVVLILSQTIDTACLRKWYSCDYDKLNISVVI